MILLCPATFTEGSTKRLALRDWPIEHWKCLYQHLIKNDFDTRIITPLNQKDNYIDFFEAVICPANLSHLFSIIESAKLVVTQDSGYMHIARFKKTKVLALFGPTNPKIFTNNHELVLQNKNIDCSPCHDGRQFTVDCKNNICMQSIEPKHVFNTIKHIISNELNVARG